MSSFIDTSNDRIYKRRLTTLDSSTKFSNNNKSNISIRRTQLYSNNSNIILPSININRKKNKYHSVLDSATLMSKLLSNFNPNNINQTQKILKPLTNFKSRNSLLIKSHSLNDIPQRKKVKYQSLPIINNKNKSDVFFNNNYYNNSKNTIESDYEDSYSINNLNSINNSNRRNLKKSNSNALMKNNIFKHDFLQKNKINLKCLNLWSNKIQNDSSTTNKINTKYKRLRKFTNILLIKSGNKSDKEKDIYNILNKSKIDNVKNNNSNIIENDYISHVYENNIKFQAKILEEQVRLLDNSYQEYKIHYSDIHFIEVFKATALDLKIKYNTTIEDACAILYYLPKLILRKFYSLMLGLIKIKIPDEEKFRAKYISNEVDTLIKNNYLLAELIYYFSKCFEFYLVLSEKKDDVPELKLNQQNFLKIIKYIQKARYNIIYLNNSYSNSKRKLLEDLQIIKKFLKRNGGKAKGNKKKEDKMAKFSKNILDNSLLLEKEKNRNTNTIEKIENQFLFEKDEETQKKKKIDNALDINRRKTIRNYLGKIYGDKKDSFKSLLWNKHLNEILNYCYDDVRNKIITEKIIELDKIRKQRKQSHKVIKFNFA